MELISVRTNTRLIINYETKNLIPIVELIIIVTSPKYEVKDKSIIKTHEVKELRFETDVEGVNELIGKMNATVSGLNMFEQMAGAINQAIDAYKEIKK